MRKLCAGRRGSVAKTCSAVPGSRHRSVVADSAGLVATNFLMNRSDRVHSFAGTPGPSRQPVGLYGLTKKRGRCGAIMNCFHSAASIAHKEAKAKTKGTKKEVTTISQRAAQIVEGPYTKERGRRMSEVRPRTLCFQLRFGTDSTLPWMEPRRNTLYIDQTVPQRGRRPWRLHSINRSGDGGSTSGSGGPGTFPRRDDGTQDPTPINDWTVQVQALEANPAWAQEQSAQWQLLHQQYQHLQYQQQLVTASTTDPWRVLPEDGGSTGDRWSMDTGTDRIGV